jgi:hypothetical protein
VIQTAQALQEYIRQEQEKYLRRSRENVLWHSAGEALVYYVHVVQFVHIVHENAQFH